MKSICVFGDSIAKGVVLDKIKNRYVYLKDSFTNIISSKADIKIENYAKFGCDIKKGYQIVSRHADELINYDYTFIEFGGNDCNFDWKSISERPFDEHLPSTPISSFTAAYENMLKDILNAGAKPIMLNLPPLDAQKFFNWVSKDNNPDNILTWLGDVDHIFRWHRDYNDAVCDIAVKNNIPLIDIRCAFLKLGNYSDYICDDGMHANEKGHRLIADSILQFCV